MYNGDMKNNNEKGNMENKEQQTWTGRDKDGNAFRLNAPVNAGSEWVFSETARLLALLGWAEAAVVMKGDHFEVPFLNPGGFNL